MKYFMFTFLYMMVSNACFGQMDDRTLEVLENRVMQQMMPQNISYCPIVEMVTLPSLPPKDYRVVSSNEIDTLFSLFCKSHSSIYPKLDYGSPA